MDVLERVFLRGLNVIFAEQSNSLQAEVLEKCPEFLTNNLSELSEAIQLKVVSSVFSLEPEKFKTGFWKEYVDEAWLKIQSCGDPKLLEKNSYFLILLNEIRGKDSKVFWFPILEKLSEAQKASKNTITNFEFVLDKCLAEDPDNLLKLVYKTDIKSYPKNLKLKLYMQVIKNGKLDVKVARRIRSDSNGDMSRTALRILFENCKKYDDDTFQTLITQFSDTKHPWVARYIALNMPTHLTPFLIGLEDEAAMRIVDKRMNNM